MKIGFIGLGNVGRKLAGSLLRKGFDLMVRDLDESLSESFASKGAKVAKSPKELTQKTDLVITCRSEEHTSELQSRRNLVCRLLLEKKKKKKKKNKEGRKQRP